MKLIIFQKINYNYIFFIFYLIFCLVAAIIEVYEDEEQNEINKKGKGHFFQVIILITICLSDFLALIPHYINKYLTKNKNKNKVTTNKDKDKPIMTSNFIYNNPYEEEIIKKWNNLNIYTFLVGFLDFLVETFYFLNYLDNGHDSLNYDSLLNSDVIFEIIIQYILSIIILKEHFYKHHYLSISINTICFIILFIFDIVDSDSYFFLILLYDIYLSLIVIENAYGKKAMIYGYISPFSLLILKGVYKIILMSIFLIIFIPIMVTIEDNFLADIKYFDSNKLFLIVVYFFSYFLKNLFNWILIDRFSPSHLALSLILENLSYLIVYTINYDGNDEGKVPIWEICIRIFIHFILFITALFHNEIFIITKWGLGANTKLFLEERQKEEMLLSNLDTDTDILKKYDTMIELEQNINHDNENNGQDNPTEIENNEEKKKNKDNTN